MHSFTTMALSYHVPTKTILGVVCGVRSKDVDTVIDSLRFARRYVSEPLILPVVLVDLGCKSSRKTGKELQHRWKPIEANLGTGLLNRPDTTTEDVDIKEMPRALTQLANTAVWQDEYLSALTRLCDRFLDDLRSSKSRRSEQLTDQLFTFVDYRKQNIEHLVLQNRCLLEATRNVVQMLSCQSRSYPCSHVPGICYLTNA